MYIIIHALFCLAVRSLRLQVAIKLRYPIVDKYGVFTRNLDSSYNYIRKYPELYNELPYYFTAW